MPDEACEVCCETAAGIQQVPASECPEGAVLPEEECTVCCKLVGNQIVPITDCPAGQVQPMSACEPTEVCCKSATGGYSWLPSTACDDLPGVVVSDDECEIERCCELSDGTTTLMTEAQCDDASGVVVADEACSVCCHLEDPTAPQGGAVLVMPLMDCDGKGGTVLGDEQCATVCCELGSGLALISQWACDQQGGGGRSECSGASQEHHVAADVQFPPRFHGHNTEILDRCLGAIAGTAGNRHFEFMGGP